MKKLAVVTVTYNAENNLSVFLPSMEKNGGSIENIFFIDNGSSDKTREILEEWKRKNLGFGVEVIPHAKNFGYAYAVNVGIRKALAGGHEHILVTNNDIIFHEGVFSYLLENMGKRHFNVLGIPASINKTDVGLGYSLDTPTLLPKHGAPLSREQVAESAQEDTFPEVGFAHGGTILFNKRFFEAVGLYDDDLFFGGDELDFLYRVNAYNGHHEDKIRCAASIQAFLMVDNLTRHNTKNKVTKAKRILQGTAHVYLKHRFKPHDPGLYGELWKTVKALAKGSMLRYFVLLLFSVRALSIEIPKYYLR